jgi:hypothetical protein
MTEKISAQIQIEEDPISGDLFLVFPDEIVQAVNMNDWEWIDWDIQPDQTVIIRKVVGKDPGDEADHF